ncbi:CRISPR-associated helicase Cas3' [Lactiplantibacillus daowaiensis]|uniref:CRISPR-associated helicase Cas3 n=1 Tax=Lactiplantibacillus daowaiensis TaxID=2559918 RepID=A0ABW1RYY3_9LACO|nr:CRISPR-associated helicase Cas3' [Lactiplantibacillus daowaiensis]
MGMKVSKQAASLWAKKKSVNGKQYWLPLIMHLIDTQNTIDWLFKNWLSEGQKDFLGEGLAAGDVYKLVKFVGFTHDLGKITPSFESKHLGKYENELDKKLKQRIIDAGFHGFDEKALSSAGKSPHALAGEALLEAAKVPESIGAIIGGHHGKPASDSPDEQLEEYIANYYQDNKNVELQKPWKQVQAELLQYGLKTSGYQSISEIPDIELPQAVMLEGLLIMADWLASSEYLDGDQNRPIFPLLPIDQPWQETDMDARCQRAIETWKRTDIWKPQPVDIKCAYQDRWGFAPHLIQQVITKAISQTIDPGIVIAEAPMGIGKTETALLATEQLAYSTGRNGLFMALPTQATTSAMFSRVTKWLDVLAKQQNSHFQINIMSGKGSLNQTYQKLPNATNICDDQDKLAEVALNSWFSGKKSILSEFTVATIDQLLLMGLKQKHLFLRHLGITGKVVVIDEAHSYDVFMNAFLYKVITWLGAYHVPVVILSATLPADKRRELVYAYWEGKYGELTQKQLVAPANWEKTQAYPLLSILDGNQLKQIDRFSQDNHQKSMEVQISRLDISDDALISHIISNIRGGGVAGVIVNTVKRAQKLAHLVPPDIKVMVLHAAFLATDRARQTEVLQATIGKNGSRPDKLIVIGTQVLEQSLDIDFDVLYTDIAPMDLILQRIGRLHRHQIFRPTLLQVPQVFLMGIKGPQDYGSGNEAIYEKYLLMKTDYFIPAKINLPGEISSLVQQVYDPKTDDQVANISQARDDFMIKKERKESRANDFQIGDPDYSTDGTIHDWLGFDLKSTSEQKMNAAVRDIKDTLEVILVKCTDEGDYLLDGRPLSRVAARDIAQQTIRIPVAVTPDDQQLGDAIKTLQQLTNDSFDDWRTNPWLKDALAFPLDQNLKATFEGWQFSYSSKFGLDYVKDDGCE